MTDRKKERKKRNQVEIQADGQTKKQMITHAEWQACRKKCRQTDKQAFTLAN